MPNSLAIQCLEQGARRGLRKAAARFVKKAIDPRAVKLMIDPLRRKEFAALGERLFREALHPDKPLAGLKALLLPGFGQMRTARQLVQNYPSLYRGAAAADRPMVKRLLQDQLQQVFTEMGRVADPKLRFWRKAVPATVGGGLGAGAGFVGGAGLGTAGTQQSIEDRLANMSLWDRMKYVLLPQSLNLRPQIPHELRATEGSQIPERFPDQAEATEY